MYEPRAGSAYAHCVMRRDPAYTWSKPQLRTRRRPKRERRVARWNGRSRARTRTLFRDEAPRSRTRAAGTGSVNRSQEAAGGAIEGEALILPGCALTESCQSLHVAPDGSRIRFELLREPE